ncbi:MAG: restriction endonuclease subunit S [Acidobacteria bacterium]|nr:restriction endonuclease subunit S [Acidobacteriota bacterium]
MIADLKPYPEYKESGLPWLGRVPRHWQPMRLKRILRPIDQRSSTGLETLLSLRRDHGIVVYAEHFSRPPQGATTIGFKLVRVGQLVVNRLQANNGLIFNSSLGGLVSPDYSVFEPRVPISMDYLGALLRIAPYRDYFRRESTGLGTGSAGFLRLYDNSFLATMVATPPLPEQAAIVRFLGWANGRLDRAVRAKRKVIALLAEQKQAIIHRSVTRGLDPSVPLKSSGIPWIGDIPRHWETISLRMRYSVELGKMLDGGRNLGRYPVSYLRNRDVQWDRVVVDHLPTMDIPPAEYSRYTLQRGDLLVCEGGQVGRCAFWNGQLPLCGFQKALHRIRSLDVNRDYPRYLFYQLQVAATRGVFSADGNENTIAHLTSEKLRRHRLAFPPSSEQRAIADCLDVELRQFQQTISRLSREIDLLREYRTRLIADVVTGKLDVREAAARLPEEPESDAAATVLGADDADGLSDDTEPTDEEATG